MKQQTNKKKKMAKNMGVSVSHKGSMCKVEKKREGEKKKWGNKKMKTI